MSRAINDVDRNIEGIQIRGLAAQDIGLAQEKFLAQLKGLGLDRGVDVIKKPLAGERSARFRLCRDLVSEWAPDGDTMQLCQILNLDAEGNCADLEREILLAMLTSPTGFDFPSYDEFASAVRIRKNIVEAARKTRLNFDTDEAERPADCWTYGEESGFTILPGKSLITALQKATQPATSGKPYSFSCYRATEYIILLGIAQELRFSNPELFRQLQKQWEVRAIKSGEFHDVFLREYGSMEEPLPLKYYVPGDRLWFRNPDPHSSDVTGYEGSWVFYLGGGLFSNFWNQDKQQPYTLTSKCLELFHWRNATYRDQSGDLKIDEGVVEEHVSSSMKNPREVEQILQEMLRLREPKGIYVDGGCIDTSREYPRWVCPGTSDLKLPGF